MKNPSVYLSGPITGCSYSECTDWRKKVEQALYIHGIDAYSPMRGKEYLSDLKEIPDCPEKSKNILGSVSAITMRDRFDCQNCDILLINVLGAETVSVGTMIEAGWADAWNKPVILVMEEGNVHDRALLRGIAGVVTFSLDEAIAVIKAILKP